MARTIQVTPEQLETTAGKIEGLAADYKHSTSSFTPKPAQWALHGAERTT